MERIKSKQLLAFTLLVLTTGWAQAGMSGITISSTKTYLVEPTKVISDLASSMSAKNDAAKQQTAQAKDESNASVIRKYDLGFDTKSLSDFFRDLKKNKIQNKVKVKEST